MTDTTRRFRDRADAGLRLAERLERFRGSDDVVVLGLPRGGIPVASEVARHLAAPLDLFLVRDLCVPGDDLAFGAIATGGVRVLVEDVVERAGLDDATMARVAARERDELKRLEDRFVGERPPVDLHGRTVLLVDDGLATGAAMVAAVQGVRALGATRVVAAVPVGRPGSCDTVRHHADEVICLVRPEVFGKQRRAVQDWYEDFRTPSDEEIRQLLAAGARGQPAGV